MFSRGALFGGHGRGTKGSEDTGGREGGRGVHVLRLPFSKPVKWIPSRLLQHLSVFQPAF